METRKRAVVKAAVAITIILLVCTVASRSIHTLLLPQVSALRVQSGRISYSDVFSGAVVQAVDGVPKAEKDVDRPAWQAIVAFRLPPADAQKVLNTGVTLSCSYSALAGEDIFVLQNWQSPATVVAAEYDVAAGAYDIRAVIHLEHAVAIGTPVQVKVASQSREYGALVPLGCVMQDAQGGAYVMLLEEMNSLWGRSMRVRRCDVAVLESNGQYAAVEGGVPRGAQLAAYPSRTLKDGGEVRVMEAA